jgi:hypothetical protein
MSLPNVLEESSVRRSPRRSIDDILARREERKARRERVFPPDFVHGAFTIDTVYETYGEEWVEQAAFVRFERDDAGVLVGASIATFSGYFLTIEDSPEGEDTAVWLAEKLATRRSIVALTFDGQTGSFAPPVPGVTVHARRERFFGLEQAVLRVTRDTSALDDWAARQTDLLTFIGLCARLGLSRLH